jgi:hypothetical protein
MRELDGESVLLNPATDCQFTLDALGTDMWLTLTTGASVQEAAYHRGARWPGAGHSGVSSSRR